MAKRTKVIPGLRLAPLIQLQPRSSNQQLIDGLTELVAQAIKGEISGIVFGVLHTDSGFTLKVLGEAERCPTYCLGMVEMLKVDLVERVMNR
jgi:hypothetical protein